MAISLPGRSAIRGCSGATLALLALSGCMFLELGREVGFPCDTRPVPTALADLELAVHDRVNSERAAASLSQLRWDERLALTARAHSHAMAMGEVPIGHAAFPERIQALSACLEVLEAAENVTAGPVLGSRSLLPVMAVNEWLGSPPHRATLFGENHHLSGVGIVADENERLYVTQIYVRTR